MRRRGGFTLMELIIATGLGIMVLMAVANLSGLMFRQGLQGAHKAEIHGTTLAVLDLMMRDISGASYLFIPTAASPTGDVVGGCTNWSSQASDQNVGAKLDASQPIHYFLYCISGLNGSGQFGSLYRYGGNPPFAIADCSGGVTLPGGCGAGADSRGNNGELWVLGDAVRQTGISRGDNTPGYAFARTRASNGVELHYIIGNSTPTADGAAGGPGHYIPHFYKVDTMVRMLKSFNLDQD